MLSKKLMFTHLTVLRRSLVCLGSLLLLTSCATNLLHNSADFKTAKEADEARKKIDYAAVIQEERAIQEKVLNHEISVLDNFATARRNFALLDLMTSGTPLSVNLKGRIDKRQEELIGGKMPRLSKIKITDLLPSEPEKMACGPPLLLMDPTRVSGSGKLAFTDSAAWSVALLDKALTGCTEELSAGNYEYKRGVNSNAPICPLDGVLKDFDKLEDNKIKGLVKLYKKANPTRTEPDDAIKQWISKKYSAYSDICKNVRTVEKVAQMLVEGCKGDKCRPGAGKDAEITGLGGALVDILKEIRSARTDFFQAEMAMKSAENDYMVAQDAYTKAAKEYADKPSDATRETLKKAGEELGRTLKFVADIGGDFGKAFVVKEQIEKIDQIIQAAATGEYDKDAIKKACATDGNDCALARATAITAHLPTFLDRLEYISTLADSPPLSGLLLEKSRLLALQQRADKSVKLRQRKIEILEMSKKMILAELKLLNDANKFLSSLAEANKSLSNGYVRTSDEFINPKASVQSKEFMLLALAKYLQTFTGPMRQVYTNEYRLIALQYEDALDYSEASLNVWKSAIEIPVSALLAYHESGLKPEEIIELLKALGLAGIAVGVF